MNRDELVDSIKALYQKHKADIEQKKSAAPAWGADSDWPWNGIVLSAATRGGSARWDDIIEPRYKAEFVWPVISELTDQDREARFNQVGRFWRKTARSLEAFYKSIAAVGGPAAYRAKLEHMSAQEVIDFWKAAFGFSDKYARNIMMDIYDERFRDAFFALDSRLKKFMKRVGFVGRGSYLAREAWLRDLAKDCGIPCWDMDRLLYGHGDELL